jgi:hypothetical protein
MARLHFCNPGQPDCKSSGEACPTQSEITPNIQQAAGEALKAGSDYLLVADVDDHIDLIVSAIVRAVQSGDLDEERLGNAAGKVRSLAAAYGR